MGFMDFWICEFLNVVLMCFGAFFEVGNGVFIFMVFIKFLRGFKFRKGISFIF